MPDVRLGPLLRSNSNSHLSHDGQRWDGEGNAIAGRGKITAGQIKAIGDNLKSMKWDFPTTKADEQKAIRDSTLPPEALAKIQLAIDTTESLNSKMGKIIDKMDSVQPAMQVEFMEAHNKASFIVCYSV